MSYTRRVAECPECHHRFSVARDEGDSTQCPKCEFGLLVEWIVDDEGERVRLSLPEIFFVPHAPPTGTIEAAMSAIEHSMFSNMGIPQHLVTPEKFDLRNPMAVVCPRCQETFNITRDYGIRVVCPYCGMGCEAEWSEGPTTENCRLKLGTPALYPGGIPGIDFPGVSVQTVDVDHYVPAPVDADRFYTYIKKPDLLDDHWECDGVRPSIIVQAQFMGMRVFNNRKRMRKRVRQRRRHWSPYDDHWSQHPGDW